MMRSTNNAQNAPQSLETGADPESLRKFVVPDISLFRVNNAGKDYLQILGANPFNAVSSNSILCYVSVY